LKWLKLPEKVVLLRHGQSEGNVDKTVYTSKGDAHLELTQLGVQQARDAGARLREVVGDDRILAVVSPFERTVQTLLGLYQGGFPEHKVGVVYACPQIRGQEFGNFQSVGLQNAARAEEEVVGRFYYRRPNGESSADVQDRVTALWEELINDVLPRQAEDYGSCLIVTHGLTMRLLLQRVFHWSVETFETVWNIDNCHHVTLHKDMEEMCYKLCPDQSFPPHIPWATRSIWIVFRSRKATPGTEAKLQMLMRFKSSADGSRPVDSAAEEEEEDLEISRRPTELIELPLVEEPCSMWLEIDRVIDETKNRHMMERAEKYTVVDYLTMPQPRTQQPPSALDGRLVHGHRTIREEGREESLRRAREMPAINWEDVEFVDWWGDKLSYQGKMLRKQVWKFGHSQLPRQLSVGAEDASAKGHKWSAL